MVWPALAPPCAEEGAQGAQGRLGGTAAYRRRCRRSRLRPAALHCRRSPGRAPRRRTVVPGCRPAFPCPRRPTACPEPRTLAARTAPVGCRPARMLTRPPTRASSARTRPLAACGPPSGCGSAGLAGRRPAAARVGGTQAAATRTAALRPSSRLPYSLLGYFVSRRGLWGGTTSSAETACSSRWV